MSQKTFKNIIIGFGKGGKTLAKMTASKGETVALIEQSAQMYGGSCPNVACVPSKFLIERARERMPFAEAAAAKNALTEKLRGANYHKVADEPTATVFTGKAKFMSNTEIEISGPDGTTVVTGERIFINTGSAPNLPDLPNINELVASGNVVTSKEIMELTVLPEKLLIIGAGAIGLEFAAMFRHFGSEVTVIDTHERFLPNEDDDVSEQILKDFTRAGVEIKLGAKIESLTPEGTQTLARFTDQAGEQSFKVDKVLAAVGRRPYTGGLGIENTGISLTERGAVKADDYLRTTVPNIWAIGDVHGGEQFIYTSWDDFRIIADQLYGSGKRKLSDRTLVPYSVFITPPLSRAGLTERQAQENGVAYKLFTVKTGIAPKAHIARDTRGFFKALVDPESNLILGAALYGEGSYEVINIISLAMKAKLPYTMLRDHMYMHPTMSELLNDLFM